MKKKFVSLLLALVMCLSLLPLPASAAGSNLPDWYFLFAVFKNVDADINDKDGTATHMTHTMSQNEVDTIKTQARGFEDYMTQTGVMRAHVDIVEIDAALTELRSPDSGSSYIGAAQAAPLLEEKVDLDWYDYVACVFSTNVGLGYLGISSAGFENGTGISCINLQGWLWQRARTGEPPEGIYTHEYLHFMEKLSAKWGADFHLHGVEDEFYSSDLVTWYDDLIKNRAKGSAGTGVHPVAWQYPPHVLRTMTELTVPSGVTSIGEFAFASNKILTRVFIPSSVTSIGGAAFQACSNLTSVSLPASITRVENYTFVNCGLTDVYYSGSEEQWKAIPIGISNGSLCNANIHYNHLMADVKTTDWFAKGVTWSVENGITAGTGAGKFSPNATCTQAQILTFLWRAYGSPEAAGKVSGSEYYAVPLQWARERGVISGSLNPNSPCTRADVVTYLWKLAGSPTAIAASFSDVPASASYAGAVSWAVEQGITSGTSAATFDPGSVCTRGQIVTFLRQALG